MSDRVASHVLLVAPSRYRANQETAESNVFQRNVSASQASSLAGLAEVQHRALRDQLINAGVRITVTRALETTPDAPFCNNWFSTHGGKEPTLVLYPMMAPSRRLERRPDLVAMLKSAYPRVVDLTAHEDKDVFLESTGSLCLDDAARIGYAAISPRTHHALAREWAKALDYKLVAFEAADENSVPYYHTNVMMFLGHGIAGICLESIAEKPAKGLASRAEVEDTLKGSGHKIVALSRSQLLRFCGNCLALVNDRDEPMFVMSAAAYDGFDADQRKVLEGKARLLNTDLSSFEALGGGSARCLLGELF